VNNDDPPWSPPPGLLDREVAIKFVASESPRGHTRALLATFGVSWPPKSGWRKRLKNSLIRHYGITQTEIGGCTQTPKTMTQKWETLIELHRNCTDLDEFYNDVEELLKF